MVYVRYRVSILNFGPSKWRRSNVLIISNPDSMIYLSMIIYPSGESHIVFMPDLIY